MARTRLWFLALLTAVPAHRALAQLSVQVAPDNPNVSGQEYDLGQQAIAATWQSGVEEGSAITGRGVVQLSGPGFTRLNGMIIPVNGWLAGASTIIHSHPSGGGISPGDIEMSSNTGLRVVSAGQRTNRFGSVSGGRNAVTCNMPNRPEP